MMYQVSDLKNYDTASPSPKTVTISGPSFLISQLLFSTLISIMGLPTAFIAFLSMTFSATRP